MIRAYRGRPNRVKAACGDFVDRSQDGQAAEVNNAIASALPPSESFSEASEDQGGWSEKAGRRTFPSSGSYLRLGSTEVEERDEVCRRMFLGLQRVGAVDGE